MKNFLALVAMIATTSAFAQSQTTEQIKDFVETVKTAKTAVNETDVLIKETIEKIPNKDAVASKINPYLPKKKPQASNNNNLEGNSPQEKGGKSSVYDDTVDGVSTVYNDGKSAFSTFYSDVKGVAPLIEEAMRELASTLKIGVSNLWDILIMQQYVIATLHLFVLIGAIYAARRFSLELKTARADRNEIGEFRKDYIWSLILFGCIFIACSYSSVTNIYNMLTGFINPRFGALMMIIDVVKSIR